MVALKQVCKGLKFERLALLICLSYGPEISSSHEEQFSPMSM